MGAGLNLNVGCCEEAIALTEYNQPINRAYAEMPRLARGLFFEKEYLFTLNHKYEKTVF